RLVTAPRPAFALLTAALVTALLAYRGPNGPLSLSAVLGLVALSVVAAGALQIVLGALRFGDIVKYTPHPVRGGLLSGVGVMLLIGALPAALGTGFGHGLGQALSQPMPGALLVAATAIAVNVWA